MRDGWRPQLAISPDGRTIAYVSARKLYIRPLDRDEPILAFEGDASAPFFSDDGGWIAFWDQNRLSKVSSDGGPVTVIPGASSWFVGSDWGEGKIIYTASDGIWAIPSAGGEARQVTSIEDDAEAQHQWPQLIEEDLLLFSVIGPSLGWRDAQLVLMDLTSGERVWTLDGATFGRYVSSGHITFAQSDGTILAVPFDLTARRATGSPFPILEDVRLGEDGGSASLAISDGGTLAFVRGSGVGSRVILRVDRQGNVLGRLGEAGANDQPDLSLDGLWLAVTNRQANNDDIWIMDTRNGSPTRITFDAREDETPIWSGDGLRLAYSAYGGRERHIYVKEIRSAEPAELVHTNEYHVHVTSWLPDGQWLAVDFSPPTTRSDAWLVHLGDTAMVPVATTPANEGNARFSPDGRWIAYQSDENEGRFDVFVVPWPALMPRQQVSRAGGSEPVWSTDGSTLYYWKVDGERRRLYAAAVARGARFQISTTEELFDVPGTTSSYGLVPMPGGREFLLLLDNPDATAREIHIVENFFEELKAKVGN